MTPDDHIECLTQKAAARLLGVSTGWLRASERAQAAVARERPGWVSRSCATAGRRSWSGRGSRAVGRSRMRGIAQRRRSATGGWASLLTPREALRWERPMTPEGWQVAIARRGVARRRGGAGTPQWLLELLADQESAACANTAMDPTVEATRQPLRTRPFDGAGVVRGRPLSRRLQAPRSRVADPRGRAR